MRAFDDSGAAGFGYVGLHLAREGRKLGTEADTGSSRAELGLLDDAQRVLPSQSLEKAVELGIIDAGDFKIPSSSIQPASVDLRLGEVAYRIRCSFLPDRRPVEVG